MYTNANVCYSVRIIAQVAVTYLRLQAACILKAPVFLYISIFNLKVLRQTLTKANFLAKLVSEQLTIAETIAYQFQII